MASPRYAVNPAVTDHVFRTCHDGAARLGRVGTRRVDPGMCVWLGTCNRPPADHIETWAFRARREAR